MRSGISRLIVLLAAFQLLGGHWVALQSVAWAGMLASYSRNDSLAGAIQKTFDGDHPCKLCHIVDKGLKQEREKPADQVQVRIDAVIAHFVGLSLPVASTWSYPSLRGIGATRSVAPSIPPPRAA